jgi:hypothetical protein
MMSVVEVAVVATAEEVVKVETLVAVSVMVEDAVIVL